MRQPASTLRLLVCIPLVAILVACTAGLMGPTRMRPLPAGAEGFREGATLVIEPTAGNLSTTLAVSLSGTDPEDRFDHDAILQWTGRYVPLIGEATEPFTITFRGKAATELSESRIRIPVAAGMPSRIPSLSRLLIPGTLQGTAVVALSSGARVEAPFDFAPFIDASWKHIRYPDGPTGLDPPTADEHDVRAFYPRRLSDLHDLDSLKPDHFWVGTSGHLAIEMRFPIGADAAATVWPATIHAEVVTTGSKHETADRVTVPLFPQPIERGATSVVYRSDVTRPIVLIDTPIDTARFPDFSLAYCPLDGHIGVTASPSQPQAGLVALARKQVLPPLRTPSEAMQALRTPEGMTTARCFECLEVFRTAAAGGQRPPWNELIALVNDTGVHDRLRWRLLQFILDDADAAAHKSLLRTLIDTRRSQPAFDRDDPTAWSETSYHCSMMLHSLSKHSTSELSPLQPEAGELLAMLAEIPASSSIQAPIDLLVALPADAEWKSAVAARIIEANGNRFGSARSPLVDLLGPAQIATFRESVAAAPPEQEHFPFGMADALADLGDREILPELRRRAEHGHPNWQRRIRWWIQMIELQAEPADLVAFATEVSEERSIFHRLWALDRALELGVTKQDIRLAILRYADAVRPQIEAARAEPTERAALRATVLASILLGELKQFGLDNGILEEGDLADVPLPTRMIGCG